MSESTEPPGSTEPITTVFGNEEPICITIPPIKISDQCCCECGKQATKEILSIMYHIAMSYYCDACYDIASEEGEKAKALSDAPIQLAVLQEVIKKGDHRMGSTGQMAGAHYGELKKKIKELEAFIIAS